MAGELPAPLARFLEALGAAGVRWTLLRPAESLVSPTGDIDVLVEPGETDRVRAILAGRGFAPMAVAGPDLHMATYDPGSDRFLWVHVQAELRVAGASVGAGAVLADAVERDGVFEPGPDWLLWILLGRALVDKGELAERYRERVGELARGWSGGPEPLLGAARERGVDPQAAVAAAAAGDERALMALAPPRPARRSLVRRLPRAPRRLATLRGWRRRRGMSVAVLGPDGAGKSSTVETLARDLPLPARVQYMGLTGGQLPRADALRVPGIVFAARIALIWLRYLRGVRQVARGGIVVFDRYTLDAIAPSGMRLSPVARLSRQIQGRSVPLPDLVLVLDASGETLHRRSGEYTPEILESWRREFARLAARSERVRVLDAERPAPEVRRAAKEAVWRRYAELRHEREAS